MTSPKDARDLFAESQAAFAPVFGVPNNDDNFKRIYKALVNALQSINVQGGEVDLSNILFSDDDHNKKSCGEAV